LPDGTGGNADASPVWKGVNAMQDLTDRYGRTFPYLRLSVISACNFSCSYCLPNGYQAAPAKPPSLRVDEISRLLQGFAGVGMRKVRITGGEPSLRKDLVEIISTAAQIPGVRDIAMTTNGCVLRKDQGKWLDAGLTALNVSVDTLESSAFHRITGHDRLTDILQGIDDVLADGRVAVKLNAVMLRGLNDDQMPAWLDYIRHRPLSIRFIELMQTGTNLAYFKKHHYRAEWLESELRADGWMLQESVSDAGPAREYRHPDYAGRIGIIAPYSRDFCAGCNRLRVTSTGDLRLCLFGNTGIPLRSMLQSDEQASALRACLMSQIGLKTIGHSLHAGETGITPHLASIGG
jgi:cyclic pyranopterin phosphate synthase